MYKKFRFKINYSEITAKNLQAVSSLQKFDGLIFTPRSEDDQENDPWYNVQDYKFLVRLDVTAQTWLTEIKEPLPKIIDNPDFSELINVCTLAIYKINNNTRHIGSEQYCGIYQAALKSVFGEDILNWLNNIDKRWDS